VRSGGRRADKPGARVGAGDVLEVAPRPYASRAGEKLAAGLDAFGVKVEGRVCLDVGAAAGGFTSALLARGAAHVHALDVARGILTSDLRGDERVTVWEGYNARDFNGSLLAPPPTLLVVDVSFIGLGTVLKSLAPTLAALEEIVALVKPQFEARPRDVERGGVIRDGAIHRAVLAAAVALFAELGFPATAVAASPLRGPAGNREFFVYGVRGARPRDLTAAINAATA
jgi:23S rRNA (cytidine1920-2'-O)/16S rRNA (cytidine1409-2'-O)-methyltransferase